jgi:zinc protease
VPRGAALALVGDFDAAAMEKEITALFGRWQGGSERVASAQPAAPPPGPTPSSVLLIAKPELEQSQIRIGYRGLERGHPDEPALLAASTILGGGFTSRLLQAIRVDRSLTYEAYCESIQDGRAGLLRVVTFTKNETTRETIDVALAEIAKFRTAGPTAEELARTQSFLAGMVARSLQAPADIAANLSMVAFYGLPADYVPRRVERLRAVQVDDVRRVAATHFAPERMALVVVGDPAAVKDQLGGLGPLAEAGFTTLIE